MATTDNLELKALQDKSSRYDLLTWLNSLLQTEFTKIEEICSGMCSLYSEVMFKYGSFIMYLFASFFSSAGACFCQMMDWLFPGSIDMNKVKFQCQDKEDFRHNYSLLQTGFSKMNVTKVRFFH